MTGKKTRPTLTHVQQIERGEFRLAVWSDDLLLLKHEVRALAATVRNLQEHVELLLSEREARR
jgi:hypothetical protein